MSQLQIEFEYHRADPRDPMSDDTLDVEEITLDGRAVPLNLHDRIEMEHLASALLTALLGRITSRKT